MSRQGRRLPLVGGNSVTKLCGLGSNLLRGPVELGAVDPHPVEDDGKLSSDRNLGLAQPASLREPDAPGFERRRSDARGQA
jgi:hypothetical protein